MRAQLDPSPHLVRVVGVSGETVQAVTSVLDRTGALVPGHFELHDGLHTNVALRFRGIARDPTSLATVASAVASLATWEWGDVTIVSPESAGFFLGAAIARQLGRPHAVVQTDLRRRPTRKVVAGDLDGTRSVVLVNDISSTGESLRPMIELARERGCAVRGALLFSVGDTGRVASFSNEVGIGVRWLVTAQWSATPAGDHCAGCALRTPLFPIAELA